MDNAEILNENWDTLTSFFPEGWTKMGRESGAITRLRDFKSEERLMRTLLIHVANGYSLRESVVVAKAAGIADVSDVALLKRLRSSLPWFEQLCGILLRESQLDLSQPHKGYCMRLVDSTLVKEPGKTGSQWRIHYSIALPSLKCDSFKITATRGKGSAETLKQYSINEGDCILGDRGFSHATGFAHVRNNKGHLIVRVNSGSMLLFTPKADKSLNLLAKLKRLDCSGRTGEWAVIFKGSDGIAVRGRICGVRKSEQAIALAHKKLQRDAVRKQKTINPQTYEYAKYVIVFTTLPEEKFSTSEILEWYRARWQIELVFKRLKSLAQMGHLPKHDEQASRAWLYGKLFIALIAEKIIRHANDFSPWGYDLEIFKASEQLEGVRFDPSSGDPCSGSSVVA